MNLLDLFALGRRHDPGAIAVSWASGTDDLSARLITHGELDVEAARIAGLLQAVGVSPGDRVALFCGNRPEWVVAFLAILRVGGVVVPINLAYRQHELAHIVADAEPKVMITEAGQLAIVAELDDRGSMAEVLDVDGDAWRRAEGDSATPAFTPMRIDGSDLAMLLYTSGTTGRSKGAMITHDNFLATIAALLVAWGWSSDDRLLLTLPLFHTHGLVVGLCTALAAGARVELRRRFELESVWAELDAGIASLFFGVPTMYTRLLQRAQALGTRAVQHGGIGRMRLFCCGSAPLSAETFEAFRTATGHTILERYGMTETGMLFSNPLVGERRAGTVGFPLPGVTATIVDEQGEAVADGAEGELWVRGSNVFEGYWRDPEKTRHSFAGDADGRRWFRTGDLARRNPGHGAVTLLGRRHELIIAGGYNIYPREIEEVLSELPELREVAVVGRPHPEWGEVPVAFVVGDGVDLERLERHCRDRIASYKVPKQFCLVSSLPRNALGKVQKHLLKS